MPGEAPIVLLTDFGLKDHYVGVMKGVIAGLSPQASIIDLTHEIPPQDIRTACFQLWAAYRYFPEGSIFVAVVDPGVGTRRKGLLLSAGGRFFLGPDNGLFSLILEEDPNFSAYALVNKDYFLPVISFTFHGRDIFAPCAAHLFNGAPLESFGPPIHDLVRLPLPRVVKEPGRLRGGVLHVDHFGNLITNISAKDLCAHKVKKILFQGKSIPFLKTYAEGKEGEPLAIIGSSGLLEIAVYRGSAAKCLGKDGEVVVEWI